MPQNAPRPASGAIFAPRTAPAERQRVDQIWQNGRIDDIRGQRRQRTEEGGRVIIEEPDDRVIVREGDRVIIRVFSDGQTLDEKVMTRGGP